MVRIFYRWQVQPANFEAFKQTWRITTTNIHASVPGALGSFMLRACEDESEIVTVAKWDSLTSWQAFWGTDNPKEMEGLRKIGNRISVDLYEEIEDQTR